MKSPFGMSSRCGRTLGQVMCSRRDPGVAVRPILVPVTSPTLDDLRRRRGEIIDIARAAPRA